MYGGRRKNLQSAGSGDMVSANVGSFFRSPAGTMSQITLKQLSELSGYSIRTVSRVLRNASGVLPEKREKITALAHKYGYFPNMAARNLRLRKKSFVGIIYCTFGREVMAQKINDLERRLVAAGYYPILGRIGSRGANLGDVLNAWSGVVDYAALISLDRQIVTPDQRQLLKENPIRFIFCDGEGGNSGHTLLIDRSAGVCELVTRMLESGRRRILHCGELSSRRDGLTLAFERFGGTAEKFLLESHGEFEDGLNAGPGIVRMNVDAVMFDTDRMAAGFLKYAHIHGIRVPEDIAVGGFDDDLVGRMSAPSLSTVAHPIAEMNSEIVRIIEEEPEKFVRKVFPAHFVRRESC